ncbi:MAG: caspase family protein, partial [Armatimonadota bacterium]
MSRRTCWLWVVLAAMLALCPASALSACYRTSWAVCVGIDDYVGEDIPDLSYCTADAAAVARTLIDRHGFPAENVTTITNQDAGKQDIVREMSRLTDTRRVESGDRVVVFFSGHGQTVPLPRGGQMGFLIPADARIDLSQPTNPSAYYEDCVAMSELREIAALIPARHVLFLVDACYSGLAARRVRGVERPHTVEALARHRGSHVLTAGMKGEVARERHEWGHGVFTHFLLRALGPAPPDYNADGWLTVQELAAFIQGEVPRHADQTPQLARLGGEGQCLFPLGDAPAAQTRAPRIEFLHPTGLGGGDLRHQAQPTGELVRFEGLALGREPIERVTADGRELPLTPADDSAVRSLVVRARQGTMAARFTVELQVQTGEERTVEFVATDAAGDVGVARVHLSAVASDERPPEMELLAVWGVSGGGATREAQWSEGADGLSVHLREGEGLRVEGMARDDRATVALQLDAEPVRTRPASQQQLTEMGWDHGQWFEVALEEPVGRHELAALDAAGNASRLSLNVDTAGEARPEII